MNQSNEKPITTLPVLPIKRSVLFPGVMLPITVGRAKTMAALEAALKTEEKTIVVVAQRDPDLEDPRGDDLFTIGTKAVIKQTVRSPEGAVQTLLQGLERVVLLKVEHTEPFLMVRARHVAPPSESGPEIDALHRDASDTGIRFGCDTRNCCSSNN